MLLITMHHIVSDGWSMGLLLHELSMLYGAYVKGEEDPLEPLEIQYGDYAVWQRRWMEGTVLREQGEYWRRELGGAPEVLELPADRPRPAQQEYAGGMVALVLDEKLTAGLKALSQRHGATLYMTLLAGWAGLLGRLSGEKDVVIGTPAANRGRAEIEKLIGFFVNTLALRVELSGSPRVGELLEQVKERTLGAQQNQDIPFEQVVELMQPARSLAHSAVFQVLFTWQNTPQENLELAGLVWEGVKWDEEQRVVKFDLTVSLQEVGEKIEGGVRYAKSLFDGATIERYVEYYRRLLEGMVEAGEEAVVERLPLMGAAEREQLLYGWNRTQQEFPAEKCVHELFEEQVERAPNAVAVIYEDQELSYGELNRRANQLAHYLRELGVKPDDRVAICVERGLEMVVGILAVLKAGGAYVPLDPAYPAERMGYMLEDASPLMLLTEQRLRWTFFTLNAALPIVDLTEDDFAWQDYPIANPDRRSTGLSAKNLAYVIYTSGSTGRPKGVCIEHRQISNYVAAIREKLHLAEGGAFGHVSTIAADLGNTVLFPSLAHGGTLRIFAQQETTDSSRFASSCREHPLDCLKITPSHFQALLAESGDPERIPRQCLVFGGEVLPRELLATVRLLRPECRIYNHYGPTECSVGVLSEDVTFRDQVPSRGPIPLGRPLNNMSVYVLDSQRDLVPMGIAGEIFIGGHGVGRGYFRHPALTAQVFLPDPFSKTPGARMYRTGDRGRWLQDGAVEFLGRTDFQVKVRGFRIELGEIEARLKAHEGIRDAVIVAREDTAGDKRLVAYYTCVNTDDAQVEADALRGHLANATAGVHGAGGVRAAGVAAADAERQAGPQGTAGARDGSLCACADTNRRRATSRRSWRRIWAELLKLERVGRHDNFFALGGHSLLAVTVIERHAAHRGLDVDIRTLFATPTLADVGRSRWTAMRRPSRFPPNRIPGDCEAITPEMLPLVRADGGRDRADRRDGAGRSGERAGHLSAGAAAGGHSLSSSDGRRRRSVPAGRVCAALTAASVWTAISMRCRRSLTGTTSCGPRCCGKACRSRCRWCGEKRALSVEEVDARCGAETWPGSSTSASIRAITGSMCARRRCCACTSPRTRRRTAG